MKMYTTPEQTAKLIELGFEKPKGWCVEGISSRLRMCIDINRDEGFNYSIGELIEMLPRIVEYKGFYFCLKITTDTTYCWNVCYERCRYEK